MHQNCCKLTSGDKNHAHQEFVHMKTRLRIKVILDENTRGKLVAKPYVSNMKHWVIFYPYVLILNIFTLFAVSRLVNLLNLRIKSFCLLLLLHFLPLLKQTSPMIINEPQVNRFGSPAVNCSPILPKVSKQLM